MHQECKLTTAENPKHPALLCSGIFSHRTLSRRTIHLLNKEPTAKTATKEWSFQKWQDFLTMRVEMNDSA
jgi:hypothetical protein